MDDQSWPSNVFLHKIIEIQLFFGPKKSTNVWDLFSALVAFWTPCMNSPLSPHIFSFVAWANYKIWKFELLDVPHT
jgi:hypothetical protein